MPTDTLTTADVKAEINRQTVLQPGESGWWRVWGSSPQDMRAGDYVLMPDDEFYVQDTYQAKAHPLRYGIVVDGERMTVGALSTVVIFRRGTKNTLSDTCR